MRPLKPLLMLTPTGAVLFGANSMAGDAETTPFPRTLGELELESAASRDTAGRDDAEGVA